MQHIKTIYINSWLNQKQIYIKCHIAKQTKQEAQGILNNIFKTIYNKISSQQQEEEANSNEPPKTKTESSAFKSYESNFIIYDISNKVYDGLVFIELSAPYLLQQVNRHGNVKIMVRVKCWVISKRHVKYMNIYLQLDNLNVEK